MAREKRRKKRKFKIEGGMEGRKEGEIYGDWGRRGEKERGENWAEKTDTYREFRCQIDSYAKSGDLLYITLSLSPVYFSLPLAPNGCLLPGPF